MNEMSGGNERDAPIAASSRDVEWMAAIYEADQAASVAHDFIFGLNGVTKEKASEAIWTIHNALRPIIEADQTGPGNNV